MTMTICYLPNCDYGFDVEYKIKPDSYGDDDVYFEAAYIEGAELPVDTLFVGAVSFRNYFQRELNEMFAKGKLVA